MINVTVAGRLGKDAEVKQVGSSTVCSFSVAGDTGFGDRKQSHWFDCSLWGKQGEALVHYLKKGQRVTVIGEFSEREHNGKYHKELRVNQIELQGSKGENNQSASYSTQQQPQQQQPQPQQQSNPFFFFLPADANGYAQQMANNAQANFGNGQAFTPKPSVIDQDVPF